MSGFSFRRRVRLDDNTRVNVSKSGASLSKRKGRATISSKGRLSVRLLPGLSWRKKLW